MANLSEDVLSMLKDKDVIKMLATVNMDKKPNLVPIGSIQVVDGGGILAFANVVSGKTKENLDISQKVSVCIYRPPWTGYQIKGIFLGWEESGSLFEEVSGALNKLLEGIGKSVQSVGKIQIGEVFNISMVMGMDGGCA